MGTEAIVAKSKPLRRRLLRTFVRLIAHCLLGPGWIYGLATGYRARIIFEACEGNLNNLCTTNAKTDATWFGLIAFFSLFFCGSILAFTTPQKAEETTLFLVISGPLVFLLGVMIPEWIGIFMPVIQLLFFHS